MAAAPIRLQLIKGWGPRRQCKRFYSLPQIEMQLQKNAIVAAAPSAERTA